MVVPLVNGPHGLDGKEEALLPLWHASAHGSRWFLFSPVVASVASGGEGAGGCHWEQPLTGHFLHPRVSARVRRIWTVSSGYPTRRRVFFVTSPRRGFGLFEGFVDKGLPSQVMATISSRWSWRWFRPYPWAFRRRLDVIVTRRLTPTGEPKESNERWYVPGRREFAFGPMENGHCSKLVRHVVSYFIKVEACSQPRTKDKVTTPSSTRASSDGTVDSHLAPGSLDVGFGPWGGDGGTGGEDAQWKPGVTSLGANPPRNDGSDEKLSRTSAGQASWRMYRGVTLEIRST